jgi:hypothetical protein
MDEPPRRRGWLRRRRDKAEHEPPDEVATAPAPPTHVRVLTPADDAPWERGFDGEPSDDD